MGDRCRMEYHPLQPGYCQAGEHYYELSYSEDCELGKSVCQMFEVERPMGQDICVIPDGCHDIVITFDGERVNGWLSPSVREAMEFRFGAVEWLFGVRFYPGSGFPARRSGGPCDVHQPVKIWQVLPGFSEIEGRLASSLSFARRHEIMVSFLREALPPPTGAENILYFCLQRLIQSDGLLGVEELAEEAGYSARYIRRLFTEYAGHSTKELAAIMRMQLALRAVMEHPAVTLSETAARFGFSDHSHMNREFKKFLGITSGQIRESERWNSILRAQLSRIFS